MRQPALILSDEDLVSLCREELRQSAGFEWDQELLAQREQALDYDAAKRANDAQLLDLQAWVRAQAAIASAPEATLAAGPVEHRP